jgi:cbb3-type cytochrome oxidase subunit 3
MADTGRSMLEKGVLQMVGVAVFTPFSLGVTYVLYNDLKLRKRTAT